MRDELYELTPRDIEVFQKARTNASWLTSYYIRKPGQAHGWEFDYRIKKPWQLDVCHAKQTDICIIGGKGSAKTVGIALAAVYWSLMTPDFAFLNTAPVVWQTRQMYNVIIRETRNTLFAERFIVNAVQRPYPMLTLGYRVPAHYDEAGSLVPAQDVYSTLEFMSVDKNAEKILTWEGDWVNIDQAEQVADLDTAIINLGTRTRGTTQGRERMGRLSVTANSSANPLLWWLADQGKKMPDTNLTKILSSYDNGNLSDTQLASFERRMGNDPKKIAVEMRAERPMGEGKEFSEALVEACLDTDADRIMYNALMARVPGFVKEDSEKAGIVHWEMPYERGRMYVVVGDPGQGIAPARNAPVVMVFDITDYPQKPIALRAFWWGNGGGKYEPWINKFLLWRDQYHCVQGAYDSTGGQKVHSEITFGHLSTIIGIDLSGNKKRMHMTTLKLVMLKRGLSFPAQLMGLSFQLTQYELPDDKIPQDLVSTLFILAGYLWYSGMETPDGEDDVPEEEKLRPDQDRYARTQSDRYGRIHARP